MRSALSFLHNLSQEDRDSHWWAGPVIVAGFVLGVVLAVVTPVRANAYGTALSPYGSSQQAVSPVPASIAFAGGL